MRPSLFGRHRRELFFSFLLYFDRVSLVNTLVDADHAAGNPGETETILAGEIRLGPLGMTAESVRINRGEADQQRERHRANGNASDELFGETKLPAQKTINCGAD